MNKKKTLVPARKLTLNRESLVKLTDGQLVEVAGGEGGSNNTCAKPAICLLF